MLASIKDNSIDAIITDPPYQYLNHKLDKSFDYKKTFDEAYRVLKKDAFLIYFGRGKAFYEWNAYNLQKFEFVEELIWEKQNTSNPYGVVGRIHETIVILRKGNKRLNKVKENKLQRDYLSKDYHKSLQDYNRLLSSIKKINNYDDFMGWQTKAQATTVKHGITGTPLAQISRGALIYKSYKNGARMNSIMRVAREHYKMLHPTQKPIQLMQKLVLLATNGNETVLDLFMGGGSTGVACKKLNRNFIGIEIDKEYYKIAEDRINKVVSQIRLNYEH